MKITIDDVLERKGLSRYWLAVEIDMRYHNLAKICNGKTRSMSFDVLERICRALQCTPNEILKID
ncbi:MAG: helix-turn-helix transcriptional regulator [Eubacteriales bacterium]|nr:helix-turn-helix transcriptional regulator [Eubacteriales bacterium]